MKSGESVLMHVDDTDFIQLTFKSLTQEGQDPSIPVESLVACDPLRFFSSLKICVKSIKSIGIIKCIWKIWLV